VMFMLMKSYLFVNIISAAIEESESWYNAQCKAAAYQHSLDRIEEDE